jgi:chemotaxis protein histidine kinase CheA
MVELPDAETEGLLKDFLAEATAALNAIEDEKDRLRRDLTQGDLQKRLLELVHTAKGASEFLSLPRLEAVAAATAGVLDALHGEHIAPTPGIVMLILGSLDRMRDLLEGVAELGHEPEGDDSLLIGALEAVPGTAKLLLSETELATGMDLPFGTSPDTPPPAGPEENAPAGDGIFLLFRQGSTLQALDLAHIAWLDLLDQPPETDEFGTPRTRVGEMEVALAGLDGVFDRRPQGPWPVVVVEHKGRLVGVLADEIHEIVGDPDVLRAKADRDDGTEDHLHIRIASPDEFFEEPF